MQGFLFSALSYGSSFTILFSGYLADLYGPRRVAMLALTVYFSLTLLSPLLAEVDFYAFLISRGVMGLAEVSDILQQSYSCAYLKPMGLSILQSRALRLTPSGIRKLSQARRISKIHLETSKKLACDNF